MRGIINTYFSLLEDFMSKARYISAIVLAIGIMLGLIIAFACIDYGFDFEILLFGYALGAAVGELIFWESIARRIAVLIFRIAWMIFLFWGSMLISGSPLFFILALFLFSPLVGAAASVFLFGLSLFGLIAAFTFPIHIFVYSRYTY